MIERLIRLPAVNANDNTAMLVEWLVEDRSPVTNGAPVAYIETTKAAIEIETPIAGYCAHLHQEGEKLPEGTVIAVILEHADERIDPYLQLIEPKKNEQAKQWTKKAELMAEKLGVDITKLAEELGRQVKESDVLTYRDPGNTIIDLLDDQYPDSRYERVLLIGGGGGGGILALDAISRTHHQRAVGILDNNSTLAGKTAMGVPILGTNNMAKQLWDEKFFDAAIIIVTASIEQREALFHDLLSEGIKMTNVIDPMAQIRTHCSLGVGNLIMANCFLAACVKLGDNNFLASHVCIEHHSVIGSHCTFGPRTTTSGAVTIGDRVKFGMGALIEPYLTIGDECVIPSGSILTSSIAPRTLLKIKRNYTE